MLGLKRAAESAPPAHSKVKSPRGEASTAPPAQPATATAIKPKKSKGEKAKADDQRQESKLLAIVIALSQLSRTTARETAILKSCLVRVTLFNKDKLPMVPDRVKEITKQYSQVAKSSTKEARAALGSPHVFVWYECLAVFIELSTKESLALDLAPLNSHMEELKANATQMMTDQGLTTPTDDARDSCMRQYIATQAKVARISKCWNPEMTKMEFCCTPGSKASAAMESMIRIVIRLGKGSERPSQAPRGVLERRIQRWLDKAKQGKTAPNADPMDLEFDEDSE